VIDDQTGVPTSPSLITRVTIDAIRAIKQGKAWPQGIYHLAPQGKTSWHEIAQTLIAYAEQQHIPLRTHVADIQAITTAEYPTAAKRPLNSQLGTHKLRSQTSFDLPHWKDDFLAVAGDIVKELEPV
jgi:dTDP-4-dehydrorhamnose reductase